jgi:hypothetical protein
MSEPISVTDAEDQLLQLKLELKDIELQLSNRNQVDENGERLQAEAYWTWYHKARYALVQKQKRIIYLNDWIKKHAHIVEATSTIDLLHGCYLILRETEELTEAQLKIYTLTREHLKKLRRIPRK